MKGEGAVDTPRPEPPLSLISSVPSFFVGAAPLCAFRVPAAWPCFVWWRGRAAARRPQSKLAAASDCGRHNISQTTTSSQLPTQLQSPQSGRHHAASSQPQIVNPQPTPPPSHQSHQSTITPSSSNNHSQAIDYVGYAKPSPIQMAAIPLGLK